ncbi:MAG: sensor histidine kinase, partial [Bacteroidaceae bacterium]|nr:sensor histidine kinase [Bacteroidaceae bacterium]
MKLIYRVTIRLSIALLPILLLWSTVFYCSMVDEINDETDDSLEDYAEMLIRRTLTNGELPEHNNGSNNTYSIEPLPHDYSGEHFMRFEDEDVYIPDKYETEPARTLTMTFTNTHGQMYLLTVSTPTFERQDLLMAVFW